MSVNKWLRAAWIQATYADAVKIFHQARRADTDETPLADLARKSANTAFADHAHEIVGDKETAAREFMAHCRNHFQEEINKAYAESARPTVEIQEARAS